MINIIVNVVLLHKHKQLPTAISDSKKPDLDRMSAKWCYNKHTYYNV